MVGSDVAPAGGGKHATPAPGRPREPIGGHYDPSARNSLDWEWTNGCRTAATSPARKGVTARPAGPLHTPGSSDPGTEIAAMERREALHTGNGVRT